NLFGHVCCGSMGDGVVHMKQVELFVLDYADHLAGQCEFVRRVFKKRIRTNIDLVVKEVFVQKVQPSGLGIGDEVYLMSFLGQGLSKFGGHHATSSKGRITDDTNLFTVHGLVFRSIKTTDEGPYPYPKTGKVVSFNGFSTDNQRFHGSCCN